MSKELISNAITLFGSAVVREVLDLVRVGSVDVIYTTLQNMNMKRHADCVAFLFL